MLPRASSAPPGAGSDDQPIPALPVPPPPQALPPPPPIPAVVAGSAPRVKWRAGAETEVRSGETTVRRIDPTRAVRQLELYWLIPEGPVSLIVSFGNRNVRVSSEPPQPPVSRRVRDTLLNDFRHPLPVDWSVETINLFLNSLAHAIALDRAKGSEVELPLPVEYRIIASRLVTSEPLRHCFPCQQTVITNTLRRFLNGEFTWRITAEEVQQGRQQQADQSTAAARATAEAWRAEKEAARRLWQQRMQQNAVALQERLDEIKRGYDNALLQGFGRAVTADDERRLAASLCTHVERHETGVATEQWFIAQLKRRLTSYRPNEARLHGQFDRPEILDLELVRGLRGECDLRVQLLSGDWCGVQTKTLSHVDGTSYQFECTDKWTPSLLIAAADNTYQNFALVWARHTYGQRFTVTFGVEAATEHTA